LLVAGTALVTPGAAAAEDGGPAVVYELDYRAPASCPGADAFTNLIARRTSRARRGGGGQGKYRFTVNVELGDAGARGTLRIAERDGGTTDRDVPARDCANALEAMALIAAVILDPRAAANAPAGASTNAAGEAPVEATGTAPAPSPHKPDTTRPPTERSTVPSTSGAPAPNPAPPASEDLEWHVRLRAAAMLEGAIAPEVAPGAAAGAELYRDRSGLFEPRFALTAHFAVGSTTASFGDATFRWYAGRLTACPLGWPEASVLTLRACAFAEAGALHGSGSNTQNPRGSTAFWLAAGPSAEIELRVNHLLALALEGGLTVPAFHDKFLFRPEVAHEVPPLGGWLALGARIGPL